MDRYEEAALLAIECSWCEAAPGKRCRVRTKKRKDIPITTLEGGFHDARWQAALGRSAPVVTEAVEQYVATYRDATYHPPPPPERPW